MAAPNPNAVPPAPVPGTSLMDRINVAIHLRRYLKLVGQRWWIIALCTLSGGGYTAYKAFTTPDRFMAWSKLTIAPRLETSRPRVQEELNNYYDRQLELMKNEAVMKKVLERLREYTTPPARPPWYSVETSTDRGSTFVMTVRSTDLNFAKQFARAWADAFVEYKTEVMGGVVSEAAKETSQQIARLEKQWDDINKQMTEFRRTNNIANAKAAGDEAQARLSELQHRYEATKQERELLQGMSREQIAEGALAKNPPPRPVKSPSNQPAADNSAPTDSLEMFSDNRYLDLQSQLKLKQAELDRLSAFLKPAHPRWIELSAEIDTLHQQVQNQLDQIDRRRKARIQALALEEKTWLPMIDEYKKEAFHAQDIQQQYSQLQEKETMIKNALENYRQEKLKIDLTSTTEDTIEPIARGLGNPLPYEPRRARMLWQGLLVGLALGSAIVYLLHRLDDRMDLAEDIEAELEEPVLGQIPQMNSAAMRDGRLLVTKLEHHNMFAESIRGVRSAIKFGSRDTTVKVMLVSSAVPGDGKTTFTVNFAATLANAGHRVLLLDADLRRGNTHTFFDHPREPGLSEVLTGHEHWTDVVRPTEINTLRVVHTGQIPANPGELLIGPVTRELIADVRKDFDYIIFDCPPLTSLDDTFSLVDLADGLIFVVKSGQTSMRFAKNALAAVRQRGFPILGIVLNGITPDNPYYYYSNYYHAYYSKEQPAPASRPSGEVSPPAKMATPRRQRTEATTTISIEAQAKIRTGELASHAAIIAEEEAKLQSFKARRTGLKTSPGTQPAASVPPRTGAPAGSSSPQPQLDARAAVPAPGQERPGQLSPLSTPPSEPLNSPPTPPATNPEPQALDTQIRYLKQLLDGGLISQQDYEARKQKKVAETLARSQPTGSSAPSPCGTNPADQEAGADSTHRAS
ncbi:MAG: polysaccharide biosynthesis tyrosine autokinase [Verrucomicrobia bacterium]|nr:polysaccharide biosynthesis tyrosine autokinase [Verrucomicrobiota bacterium]